MSKSNKTSQAARNARAIVASRDRARTPRGRAILALVLGRRLKALQAHDG